MGEASGFISWYRIQNFPIFSEDMLEVTSRSLSSGYEKAYEQLSERPGAKELRFTIAMQAILREMKECDLGLETACFILRRLNSIAQPEEPGE